MMSLNSSEIAEPGGKPAAPFNLRRWSSIYNSVPSDRSVHSIDLDVTEACNLACAYCFKWQKKAVHMDEATAKLAIDWLLEASGSYGGELKVNLMGGEPLLRFDLIQAIVPYGKCRARQMGKHIHFGCTTNCTLLTDEMLDFWKKFGMGFHCSVDGLPEVQNKNRPLLGGGPSAPRLEVNVRKILDYRPNVMARATITPASVRLLLESAEYLISLGFQSIAFKAAVNCEWQSEDYEALRRSYKNLAQLYIKHLGSEKPIRIEELERGLQNACSIEPNGHVPCGAGHGLVLIDPRGDIWPCHRFGPHLCGGQFHLGKMGESFNDRLREVFLKYNLTADTKAGCRRCPASSTCRTWCYAECVECAQSLYDPGPVYCRIMTTLHEEIMAAYNQLRSEQPKLLELIAQRKQ